jgi:hypothetical protein
MGERGLRVNLFDVAVVVEAKTLAVLYKCATDVNQYMPTRCAIGFAAPSGEVSKNLQ